MEGELPTGSYQILIRGNEAAYQHSGALEILSNFKRHIEI